MTIRFQPPDLQIDFAARLADLRSRFLQDALRDIVVRLHVPDVDKELAGLVPAHSLAMLAGHGLRGEMIFPVPLVLAANPGLLGYYRLLYGYSQKEFYTAATGAGRFRTLEEHGTLSGSLATALPGLCDAMCRAGVVLLAGIGTARISAALLDDLTLLTLGPQLRGGANVRKGSAGIRTVFNTILEIVRGSVVRHDAGRIEIRNAAGRPVVIAFAPDPDIIIREQMQPGQFREIIAIEVKAGADFSNVHNRVGEAEKSHQKARARGFVECWTVVNVDNIDIALAHKESPTTNRFYRMSDLAGAAGSDYRDFRDRVLSLTGLPAKP